ncbi:MAG: hypothetical protein ACM3PY_18505 [Omnitrophica WOR_2 bacterium]
MKNHLYVASVIVLIVALMTVVPASAGKPVKSFAVVYPTEPVAGVNWSPWVTINWEGYRAYSVGYYIAWTDSEGVLHPDDTSWQMTSVDPRAKGPQTLTLAIPGTYTRLVDDPDCSVYLGGAIFDAKDLSIKEDNHEYAGICIEPVP